MRITKNKVAGNTIISGTRKPAAIVEAHSSRSLFPTSLLQELADNGCTGLLFGNVKITIEKI